jgi:hypothetical protein
MIINDISQEHQWLKFPSIYNIHPIFNEIHPSLSCLLNLEGDRYSLDDYYGRLFDSALMKGKGVYGLSEKMGYYFKSDVLEIVEEYRVPYRRIPIFHVDNKKEIMYVLDNIKQNNKDYDILLRGQTKQYFLPREKEELETLYGSEHVKEPSFLPSSLRTDYEDTFLLSMWVSQATTLLNHIVYDYRRYLTPQKLDQAIQDIERLKNSPHFDLFALGLAQHYGLPSTGLDLTDSIDIASWFAIHNILVSSNGFAKAHKVQGNDNEEPTIYIFRCPKNAVFEYKRVRPEIFPLSRPDKQNAWFGHVGWGKSKNQLGGYLVCGFRLSKTYIEQCSSIDTYSMFPSINKDSVLQYFIKIKNLARYEGKAKRCMQGVYCFE